MPVIQASSKPPNLLMTSIPSLGLGLFIFKACFTTSILMASRSSEILVPLPVACLGVRLQRQATIAALDVVLAMPISPGKKQRYPCLAYSFTSSIPVSMARIACSRVIAGPLAQFCVP